MATHLRMSVVATMLWTAPLAIDVLGAHDLYVAPTCLELDIAFQAGHRHLPIVRVQRAA